MVVVIGLRKPCVKLFYFFCRHIKRIQFAIAVVNQIAIRMPVWCFNVVVDRQQRIQFASLDIDSLQITRSI
jgi:hypothetical protein